MHIYHHLRNPNAYSICTVSGFSVSYPFNSVTLLIIEHEPMARIRRRWSSTLCLHILLVQIQTVILQVLHDFDAIVSTTQVWDLMSRKQRIRSSCILFWVVLEYLNPLSFVDLLFLECFGCAGLFKFQKPVDLGCNGLFCNGHRQSVLARLGSLSTSKPTLLLNWIVSFLQGWVHCLTPMSLWLCN